MPRMRRQAKQKIAEPIPTWLLNWAERGLESGDWDSMDRDPDVNIFVALAFHGIEEESATALVRAVQRGDLQVSDAATINHFQAEQLAERLSREY